MRKSRFAVTFAVDTAGSLLYRVRVMTKPCPVEEMHQCCRILRAYGSTS